VGLPWQRQPDSGLIWLKKIRREIGPPPDVWPEKYFFTFSATGWSVLRGKKLFGDLLAE
jgi:hypothetical protein